jgi:hypothetical protein
LKNISPQNIQNLKANSSKKLTEMLNIEDQPINNIESQEQVQKLVNEMNLRVTESINNIATEFIGKSNPGFYTYFFIPSLTAKKKLLYLARRRLGKENNLQLKKCYHKWKHQYRTMIYNRKQEMVENYYRNTSKLDTNSLMKLCKRINMRESKTYDNISPDITAFHKHYEEQVCREESIQRLENNEFLHKSKLPSITEIEIRLAINRMPNSKSSGVYDIPAELLKI